MSTRDAFPKAAFRLLAGALLGAMPLVGWAFSAKPDDPQGAKVVEHLMATNFTKQCDVNTYPLRKNLSFLFDNKYIGLEFESWEVEANGESTYKVRLHYVDGEAGPTTAVWEVDLDAQESQLADDNAEVLSCMTGYL
jgi:hypothetical protein